MKQPSPHDEYFKVAFSEIEIVRDFLEQLVPKSLTDALDLDTLSLKSGSSVGNLGTRNPK